ncbi:MAG TPA: heme-binding beta-barrel domain-containing protein [Microbacteriaceae bacterium]|nr:heme-binding beta-barrel domain-containing protein [Microbacteriaceae bacterium]
MTEVHGPRRLGPLSWLVGEWEGDVGKDVSYHNKDDETTPTGYFEKAWFRPIPVQENGRQSLEGLNYKMTAWRHGEEAMDPFHDEVGYLLWEKATGQVLRTAVFGRGIAMIAGGDAGLYDEAFTMRATPGDANYGVLQNKYLSERAELRHFECAFTHNADGTVGYRQTLVLRLAALGGIDMEHTDQNTLRRVRRLHPSALVA